MNSILIGLNTQFSNETSYDVYVSSCDPTSWQLVDSGLSYSDFPISVGLGIYGLNGDCFQYYVSGNTGCSCISTGTTNPCPNPTPTPTPTVTTTSTQTPTPTNTQTPTVTPTNTLTPTPTTSQTSCVSMSLNWTFNDSDACLGVYTNTNTYYTSLPLSSGNVLYSDSECTTPVNSGRYIVLGVGNVLYVDNGGLLTTHNC